MTALMSFNLKEREREREREWVRIPSTPSKLFSICIIEIVMRIGQKETKIWPNGLAPSFLPSVMQ